MNLPFFYIPGYSSNERSLILEEETSRHIIQVLRMRSGEKIHLTNGSGVLLTAEITSEHKKHCAVDITSAELIEKTSRPVSICISLLKNSNRFEWFLEKATELGVHEIVPLLCVRTEKEKFRHDRMQQICISAMLQSKQTWLPILREPVAFEELVKEEIGGNRFIAHCVEEEKRELSVYSRSSNSTSSRILIGPEGDFTNQEIALALQNNYLPVSLGHTRLRTETAGVASAVLLCL